MARSDIVLRVTVRDEKSLPILRDGVTLGLVFIGLEGSVLTGLLGLGQETRFCEKGHLRKVGRKPETLWVDR